MPDCDYCSASFDSKDEQLEHYARKHHKELTRIDSRKVKQSEYDYLANDVPPFSDEEKAKAVAITVSIILFVVLTYVLFF